MGAGKHASGAMPKIDFSKIGNVKKSISFIKILVIFTILFVIVGGAFAIKMVLDNQNQLQVNVASLSAHPEASEQRICFFCSEACRYFQDSYGKTDQYYFHELRAQSPRNRYREYGD